MVTQERLKQLINYDETSGTFTWRLTRNRVTAGQLAGSKQSSGYFQISIDGKRYLSHRLAWLYVYGEFPNEDIDHINRDRTDNRIENLRPANRSENFQNKTKYRNNKSGISGVFWCKKTKKWLTQISQGGKVMYKDSFDSIEAAGVARSAAKAKYHTFHPEENNEKAS